MPDLLLDWASRGSGRLQFRLSDYRDGRREAKQRTGISLRRGTRRNPSGFYLIQVGTGRRRGGGESESSSHRDESGSFSSRENCGGSNSVTLTW